MKIKRQIVRIVSKLTNTHIYRTLPRGVDPFYDMSNQLPRLKMDVIFDIGANVGQSSTKYVKTNPKSRIYCFEPVEQTFLILQKNLQKYENIHKFKLAFGASRGKGNMRLEGPSEMFFLEKHTIDSADRPVVEEVRVDTVDHFCSEMNLSHINYLKADTEGGDLDVLRGAENMLKGHCIDVVEVEAGMNPKNHRHVRFEDLKNFLEEKDYFVFGIYEQMYEWILKEPQLRRINAMFISSDVIANNKK